MEHKVHTMSGTGTAALVVDGEASESDAEIEASEATSKAFVVSGEAPESDEEGFVKLVTPADDVATQIEGACESTRERDTGARHRSLLHRKLWESNVRLRSTAEGLLRRTCEEAAARLGAADKMLLSAQESLRGSAANMSLARARLVRIKQTLHAANCTAALSSVRASTVSH